MNMIFVFIVIFCMPMLYMEVLVLHICKCYIMHYIFCIFFFCVCFVREVH